MFIYYYIANTQLEMTTKPISDEGLSNVSLSSDTETGRIAVNALNKEENLYLTFPLIF